jgi:uncharacterized tellurite resistance protein B-like protein
MFKNIFKKQKSLELINTHEADVALRLMFEIAISDGSLDQSELELIKKRANLIAPTNIKASTIVKKIIDETEESISLYPTVKKINDTHSKSEKKELLEMLWELVAVDNLIDPYEENLFFKIADLIKIPRSQANQIKQKSS